MDRELVPEENIQIYCYLYKIENGLRELIIDLLKAKAGPRWYRNRLPGDILDRYLEGRKSESSIPWTQLIPHHPIYYIDFTDLKKIIERSDNWRDIFEQIFKRKDSLNGTLSEIVVVRNKIAHNRKATYNDLEIVIGAYTKLSRTIGEKKFIELVSRCTCAVDIQECLTELREEAESSFHICKNYNRIEELLLWESIHNEWWFDDSYLGCKLEGIIKYFEALQEYANLARKRGSGYKIEYWVKHVNLEEKYTNAQIEFSIILK